MARLGPAPAGIVRVAVDCPLRSLLDYLPPPGLDPQQLPAGSRVRVPMGRRSAVGVVVEHAAQSALAHERLRPVSELLDPEPLFDPPLLELLRWTAGYYHHPPGEVFAAALPAALRAGQAARAQEQWLRPAASGLAAAAAGEPRRAPRQRELLALLAARPAGMAAAAGAPPRALSSSAAGSSLPGARRARADRWRRQDHCRVLRPTAPCPN
jgi:primosomal protein N' (replication factor Y) (superfamily II helicase)